MDKLNLSYVKKGELFKRKPDAKKVFVRGDYDRATQSYACHEYNDVNREIFLKRKTLVSVNFTF